MANFTRLRLPGFWVIGSVVDPEEFEALDAMRELVPNFGGGSTHAPTVVVIIGGQGLRMTGPTDIDGDLDQDAASTWSLNGIVNFLDNSLLDMKVSSTQVFRSGSLLQILSGADVDIYGNATWQANKWPLLTNRSTPRNGWKLAGTTYTGSSGLGPDTPHAWISLDGINGTPTIQTIASTSSAGRKFIVQLLDLPPGATISTVTITTRGTAGDSGVELPTYRLVRWNDSSTLDPMSADTEDAHDPDDWTADREDTVVTCTSDAVVDGAYNYGILVIPPAGATAASMQMFAFKTALTASSIQL